MAVNSFSITNEFYSMYVLKFSYITRIEKSGLVKSTPFAMSPGIQK